MLIYCKMQFSLNPFVLNRKARSLTSSWQYMYSMQVDEKITTKVLCT